MAAMLLLGWAVGKRSTEVDDWFQGFGHSPVRWLLFFTDPRVLAIVLAACVAVALYRQRWRLAAVIVASPAVAVALVQLFKRLFDRHKGSSGSSLAYPSGHTAVMVVVLGMVVLLAGAALWAVLVAVAACLLGMLGQAVTYHYFTDTVGALLLGTAIVCVVAQLDRCQPRVRPTSQPELA